MSDNSRCTGEGGVKNIQNRQVEGCENIIKMQEVPPNSSEIKMEGQRNKLVAKNAKIRALTRSVIQVGDMTVTSALKHYM